MRIVIVGLFSWRQGITYRLRLLILFLNLRFSPSARRERWRWAKTTAWRWTTPTRASRSWSPPRPRRWAGRSPPTPPTCWRTAPRSRRCSWPWKIERLSLSKWYFNGEKADMAFHVKTIWNWSFVIVHFLGISVVCLASIRKSIICKIKMSSWEPFKSAHFLLRTIMLSLRYTRK